MASSTFNTLQRHLFSVTLFRANVSHIKTRVSITDQPPKKRVNLRTAKENGNGFSSARAVDERIERSSVKNLGGSVVEKTDSTKDKNIRKNLSFRERRKVGSGNSSLRSKDENIMVNSSSVSSLLVNEKKKKKPKKGDDKLVGEEHKGRGSKKNESPAFQLRVELDMCSKRGDVLGAIQLYDKALGEGIELGQYHYTVLLYLCSSAAMGVIRPAKSGSDSRSLNTLDSSNGVSSLNSRGLSALRDKSSRNLGDMELNIPVSDNEKQVDFVRSHGTTNKMELNSSSRFDNLSSSDDEKEKLSQYSNGFTKSNAQLFDGLSYPEKGGNNFSNTKDGNGNQEDRKIQVGEDVKSYALQRGFEIYKKMCLDNVPMNEAALTSVARMAMSMGNGDLAFDMVKEMKPLGINPRLRSYVPALSSFCNSGDIDKAFVVEKHMLAHGVYPEEPDLEALLRVSVGASKGDKVYYLLHKLRTSVRKVSPTTADLIVKWFNGKAASRVGKTKWDKNLIEEAIANGGGGWHGQGWLGKGRWSTSYTTVGADGLCKCCGERLAMIDLDPKETENFAESVASIAIKRERNSSFQKFQKWLDYYGPFEAVVDAANIGLFSQKRFMPSRVSAVVNGIRQKLPSKKWPLIVLHNKRMTGRKMDEPVNRALIEKWKNGDALYATPTGSNDDWYWLYAAIKFKCLLVTNDEMRDHTFQLLGNDFFPKWKERHQVHFRFSDAGPIFHMPPPCSVVIQESDTGHWHIPVASEHDYEAERTWLCVTRAKSLVARQDSATSPEAKSTSPLMDCILL
ncbi:proteinaceous RNase P 1, chloroplastic/mitochondrial-like isoform X2 [Corylus avellana]|uniref:proteinaceous RNase P 1, chloroplastic/mitochondrial-like isoform X2 n=1 Tax=Corylus avellana TaxID=13451 RepID=UPI00286C31EB|nr:proteinaceous RNase P 1, chloroplastic/mitochondrial-like isoform X2 [Corylus avellana]